MNNAAPADSLTPEEMFGSLAGCGQLFLTDRRLLWQHEPPLALPLRTINGAYAILTLGMAVAVGLRLYFFRFRAESVRKWITHLALIAPQVQAETGRRINVSHF